MLPDIVFSQGLWQIGIIYICSLGSKHPPLLMIEPEDIVVDILLIMLHVTDILPSNLIVFKAEQDRAERRKKTDNRRS